MDRILSFMFCLVLVGCASLYTPISVDTLNFPPNIEADSSGIDYTYKKNVLLERGNGKYVKKARKNNIQVIAVKMKNNSSEKISIREDVRIRSGNRIVYPMEPGVVYSELKQGVAIYVLYCIFANLTYTDCNGATSPDDCNSTFIPSGIAIGIGNMAVGASSNSKFKNEIYQENILNRIILPGEEVSGLIFINETVDSFMSFELIEAR